MPKRFDEMEDSNRSANPDIHAVSDPARRAVLSGGLGTAMAAVFGAALPGCMAPASGRRAADSGAVPGFEPVPVGMGDALVVPAGYVAEAIAPWGEPVGVPGRMPVWRPDASDSADDQAVQMGMHHDGLQYYPLDGSRRGLLAMNHEYVDDGLLHPDGTQTWSAEKVRKAQAAHGVSVIEVVQRDGRWSLVRPSRYARRITAATPFAVGGPAAGHVLMRTAADPEGRTVLGTLNNCASGITPWGTYLSGEENFAFYFDGGEERDAHQRRWGMPVASAYRWAEPGRICCGGCRQKWCR
jgi:secreted PhoX family phosphatase